MLWPPLQNPVEKDEQLQAWADDLANKGDVHGMPDKIESVKQLTAIVTNVIFICGPQHSAINFTQVRLHCAVKQIWLAC